MHDVEFASAAPDDANDRGSAQAWDKDRGQVVDDVGE
jgi:hypothetical protein